jgi:hypothetical protein
MGFLNRLFGGNDGNEGTATAGRPSLSPQVARLHKKASNKYGQAQDRQQAIASLAELGTHEAIATMLLRYTFRIEQTIGDEEEKRLVYDELIRLGRSAVDPILEFLEKQNAPYWPTRALREIVGEEEAVTHLLRIIDAMEAIFDRDVERKIELVSNLREFRDSRVRDKLMELLHDDQEELRVHGIEGLVELGSDEMGDVMIGMLLDENETQRIRTTILNLIVDRKWKIKKFKEQLRKVLPEAFWVDDVGVIHRR